MNTPQFDALIAGLEQWARRHPRRYRWCVAGLALLGQLGLHAVPLLVLVVLAMSVRGLLAVHVPSLWALATCGLLGVASLRALRVHLAPFEGQPLSAAQAPALYALLSRLRADLRAPRVHRVLLTDELNAAIAQVPRFGAFGWHCNVLLIGLPLLKCLSQQQLAAVLAHEFAHLAGGEVRLSGWIYRLRGAWERLRLSLTPATGLGGVVLQPFVQWYVPYFRAYSLPFARRNEFEADALAAQQIAPQALAEALTALSVVSAYMTQRYWPDIHRQAEQLEKPTLRPYATFGAALRRLNHDDSAAWLAQALRRETTAQSTHPALGARLARIGCPARLALPDSSEAADRLLGAALPTLTAALDRDWQRRITPSWRRHHDTRRARRQRLQALQAAADGELSLAEARERARLEEHYGAGIDAARRQWQALYRLAPDDAEVCLALGCDALRRDDATGIALVERAVALDADALLSGGAVLRDYHRRRGDDAAAQDWQTRVLARRYLLAQARLERERLCPDDTVLPHGLDARTLARLRAQLHDLPGLARVYYLRKKVLHLPEQRCYVLGFVLQSHLPWQRIKRIRVLQQRLLSEVQYPGETLVLSLDGRNRGFRRLFKVVEGARLF